MATSQGSYVMLPDRGVVAVGGAQARAFLQGLISNDIDKATAGHAVYAALLTPQGKYLFDFMIVEQGDWLLLETEAGRLAALIQRLTLYRLRAKVEITDVSDDFAVAAVPGRAAPGFLDLPASPGAARALEGGVLFVDPRLVDLGARALLPAATAAPLLEALGLQVADPADYRRHRLGLGVPDGSQDLAVERATLLESGFEELNGVDFKKGCFVGQELTARMKYRTLVRKRLMPVTFDGPPPPPGAVIKAGAREIGEMRSAADGLGLALLRLDKLGAAAERGEALTVDDLEIHPVKPGWVNF